MAGESVNKLEDLLHQIQQFQRALRNVDLLIVNDTIVAIDLQDVSIPRVAVNICKCIREQLGIQNPLSGMKIQT